MDITLLPALSRSLKRPVDNRKQESTNVHELFRKTQKGFRKVKSCATNAVLTRNSKIVMGLGDHSFSCHRLSKASTGKNLGLLLTKRLDTRDNRQWDAVHVKVTFYFWRQQDPLSLLDTSQDPHPTISQDPPPPYEYGSLWASIQAWNKMGHKIKG